MHDREKKVPEYAFHDTMLKKAEPYNWHYDPEVDAVNPSFVKMTDFAALLKPDYKNDAKIFKEVKNHLLQMSGNETYLTMKTMLTAYPFTMPEKKKISRGERVKDYSNAVDYTYPEAPDSIIKAVVAILPRRHQHKSCRATGLVARESCLA